MTEQICDLVIEHQKVLGGLAANLQNLVDAVTHIKGKVDNGLSDKLLAVEKKLDKQITNGVTRDAVLVERNGALDAQNWFKRLFAGSVKKAVGLAITFIVFNALVSNGLWAYLKVTYLKEVPGQQQAILSHLSVNYHGHLLPDGRTLLHAGDASQPAWVLNPVTGAWDKAPTMRTEQGILK